jgi:hypothetical protein
LIDTQLTADGTAGQGSSSLTLGSVANISLAYDHRLTQFSTGYSNSISPSAIGEVLQTDSLFINYSYRFARHISFDASGTVSRSQAAGDEASNSSGSNFDRNYFIASAYLVWEFERNWQLKGGYLYKFQQYKQAEIAQSQIAETSDSNTVMILLTYAWDGFRDSR